ncbi:cell division protein FtsL [Scopulibacillus darangshiensis]|uniref:Cell division protein FtsL n=1 Tax=Scopulibacillus darangshiensis TaxID=442528 RepID=A0A4R2P4T0_9BACL|nr:cell division protein FtsL [Scopulibacillus darangshiensis]TCP29084.1 cell division protein FtsL [Scopulibacillus darangshiensis]
MNQTARHLTEGEQVVTRRHYQQETPVLPKRTVTKGEKLLWSIGALVVMVLAILIVSNQAKLFSASSDISGLENKLDTQSKVNHQLKVEVTELAAPERIIQYAKDKLGLKLDVKNVKVLP